MKKKLMIVIASTLAVGFILFMNQDKLFELHVGFTEGHASFTVEDDKAYMNGVISEKTIQRVKDLIKNHPEVKTIVMENVGGSIDDESNLIASRLVREAGLNTDVPKGGLIASGGVDFFCAGVQRTAHKDSTIGVHSWSGGGVDNAIELSKDHPEHQKYLDYYKEMGIPESFYWFTLKAAPADDIYNMTESERIEYLIITN